MKELTGFELNEISGGEWDWGDFLQGFAVGCGITALAVSTGGMLPAAAVIAWIGAGAGVAQLYLD
jgi:hypothetical protein